MGTIDIFGPSLWRRWHARCSLAAASSPRRSTDLRREGHVPDLRGEGSSPDLEGSGAPPENRGLGWPPGFGGDGNPPPHRAIPDLGCFPSQGSALGSLSW